MRKILNKYSCVFFFLVGSFVVFAVPPPGLVIPPGHECCEDLAPPSGQIEDASPEFLECIDPSTDPGSYCTVPIDNSRYIYISIVAAVAFASFIIARRIKT